MNNHRYSVGWKRSSTHNFGKLFNVKHETIYDKSIYLLSADPYRYAYGKADYPGFEFNGMYWTQINNVIILYKVLDDKKKVIIETCVYENTERSHQVFYGIEPDNE